MPFYPACRDGRMCTTTRASWHFRFNGPTPEALVKGRERTYFEHHWNDFAADKKRSLSELDRASYRAAYARPG